jgi:hypothetical protein
LSGLKLFGSFILWSIPVLVFIYGLQVTKTIEGLLWEGVVDPVVLPEVWKPFSPPQLLDLIAHLKSAVPALARYHTASFFRFPVSSILSVGSTWYLNAAAVCNMFAAPIFTASIAFAFSTLHKVEPGHQLSNFIVSAILGLINVPMIPWVGCEIEYSGRKLKRNLEDFFLPKWFLAKSFKLNNYREGAFRQQGSEVNIAGGLGSVLHR